ncbi:hypothetical protein ACVIQT_009747 [Bradyrhizobium diazoefficiens]
MRDHFALALRFAFPTFADLFLLAFALRNLRFLLLHLVRFGLGHGTALPGRLSRSSFMAILLAKAVASIANACSD